MRRTIIGAAALAASMFGATATPALAQSTAEMEELKAEVRRLREELNALKRAGQAAPAAPAAPAAAAAPAWGDRIDELELKQKDAVVAGDVPGSFRLPGSETSVRIYGFAEGHLIHDFEGTAPGDNFTNIMEQPLKRRDAGFSTGKTKLTAETSRIGFETATPTQYGVLSTKVEGDFYAYCSDDECNRNRFRLRLAYGDYAGWRIGQEWSTFMDLDDLPETVDFNGPVGAPFSRKMLVRYTYGDVKAGYKLAFAVEDPADGASMPDLVARFDKGYDWGAINARVLAHQKRADGETKYGWGAGIGGNYKLSPSDLLMGQVAYVEGDADGMFGTIGWTTDNGKILFDKVYGAVVGWQHLFSPVLRSNVVFGMTDSRGNPIFDNERLYEGFFNVFYSPVKNVDLGAEFIYGKRYTFDDDQGTLSRFDLLARYSF